VQVLVDADNVHPARLRALLDALRKVGLTPARDVRITVSGRPAALADTDWPDGTELIERIGWQSSDVALADAYTQDDEPLVVASGDGDFGQLVARHPGPVLVVAAAESTAGRLRDVATVVDPVHSGIDRLVNWLRGATRG
jgi:hypothetical protein